MKKTLKIIIILLITIVWMMGIFKLSGMNSKNSNGKSTDIISMFIEDTLDFTNDYNITSSHPSEKKIEKASKLINAPMRKIIHMFVYFVLAFFCMLLLNIILDYKKYFLTIAICSILCVTFAITDEFHQTFIEGRTGQIIDVLIDSLGMGIGILFYSTYYITYKIAYKKALNEKIV